MAGLTRTRRPAAGETSIELAWDRAYRGRVNRGLDKERMTQAQQAFLEEFAAPLIGLPVAHAWRGYGSAIFLEFGALTPSTRMDGSPGIPEGEMSLMIEWSWRIEGRRSILWGSWSDEAHWPRALACLTKARVSGVTTFGRLPEIDPALSTGMHVVSLMTASGGPQWTLFDKRGERCRWLRVRLGVLRVEDEPA